MTILLKDWSVVKIDGETRLHGVVFGHRKFIDGSKVVTSEIQSYDPDTMTVRTLNTEYKLDDYTLGEYVLR